VSAPSGFCALLCQDEGTQKSRVNFTAPQNLDPSVIREVKG